MAKGRGTTELREEQLLFWPEEDMQSSITERRPQKLHRRNRIAETRYENLCYVIDSKFEGSSSLLASQIGAAQEQIDNVLSAGVTRSPVSAKLARRIEKSCGLDALWLDQKHADPTRLASKIALLDVRARLALEAVISALIDA
tara:strand:+ start:118 stop:546 length:429 start_codon:yes stop_codon:yes gene_type:complete